MHTEGVIQYLTEVFGLIESVHDTCNYWDACQFSEVIGARKEAVAKLDVTFLILDRFPPKHEVWKVDIPLMWWYVGALGHVTEVT